MTQLPNGCTCSKISVHPKNWNKPGASIKVLWYIHYYFRDPKLKQFKNGKLCIIKSGINRLETLEERRNLVKALIIDEREALLGGYNPHTKTTYVPPAKSGIEVDPYTPFIVAITMAAEKLKVSDQTACNIQTTIKNITLSAKDLGYDKMPVSRITRKYITLILENCENIKDHWSPYLFNQYRSYLMMLFKRLVQLEAVESNPVTSDIPKEQITLKVKSLLTIEERLKIDEHLSTADPKFHRFVNIFFHSGARPVELTRLRVEDVYIDRGLYKITVRKGKSLREEYRPIKNVAIPFWTNLVQAAQPGDFIFGKDLRPGPVACLPNFITRRWHLHVKTNLKIKKDLYSLKHLNLDETASELNLNDAARMAGHQSTVITLKHYALNEGDRQNERLKQVANKFAG